MRRRGVRLPASHPARSLRPPLAADGGAARGAVSGVLAKPILSICWQLAAARCGIQRPSSCG